MPRRCGLQILLTLFLTAAACAPAPRGSVIVLLPDLDGTVGKVAVTNQEGTTVLDQAYETARVESSDAAPGEAYRMEESEVDMIFGAALEAQPKPPARFILYFESASTDLTGESMEMLPLIIEAVRERNSVDTSVVGHADTAGSEEYNLSLSRERAEAVGKLLISRGLELEILNITSHGEEDLLVETGDNVDEPRNRRVEGTVR